MRLVSVVEQTLRIAVPYLLAASGGVLGERSGIVSLGLEGFMLTGAFAAVLGTSLTGSPWIGLLTGLAAGCVFGAIHALLSLRYRANQIVLGIAENLLAVGATRLFLKLVFKSSSNSGRVAGFGEAAGAWATVANPLFLAGLAAIPIAAFVVARTPFGLRLRAAGEHPEALTAVGVSVVRVRAIAVVASGALAALGGTYLALDQHQFTDEMTAGRGFIAVTAIVMGAWRPLRVGVACLAFAAAEALEIQVQVFNVMPSQIASILPYVLAIVVLVAWGERSRAPSALGRPLG